MAPAIGLSEDEILERLRTIVDPCSAASGRPQDIVTFGLVREIRAGTPPTVVLHLTEPMCMYHIWFRRQVQDRLGPEAAVEFVSPDEIWEAPAGNPDWATLDLQPRRSDRGIGVDR